MLPALEKRRSTPADVAGQPSHWRAMRARWGSPSGRDNSESAGGVAYVRGVGDRTRVETTFVFVCRRGPRGVRDIHEPVALLLAVATVMTCFAAMRALAFELPDR